MVLVSNHATLRYRNLSHLVLYVFFLAVSIFFCVNIVKNLEENADVEMLQNSSRIVAYNISSQLQNDKEYLSSLANILSKYYYSHDNKVLEVLTSYKASSFLTEICILFPKDVVLRQDGRLMNVKGVLSFEDEAALGVHVSENSISFMKEYNSVVRIFVPIINKEGKTVGMLYAIIDLEALNHSIKKNLLIDANTQLYLFNSKTGDLLIDTLHGTLGNINMISSHDPDLSNSKDLKQAFKNIRENKSGNFIHFSPHSHKYVIFHYEPLGVNDWYIALSLPKKAVFSSSIYISNVLYVFIVFVFIITAWYILSFWNSLKENENILMEVSSIDATTKLYNRNRFTSDTRCISSNGDCPPLVVYVDANGLHEINNTQCHKAGDEMLKQIAKALARTFKNDKQYRIGGDEFFVICSSKYEGKLQGMIEKIKKDLREYHYEIAVGVAYKEQCQSVSEMISVADASMLADKREFYRGRKDRRKSTDR